MPETIDEVYQREAEDSLTLNRLPYEIRARLAEFTGAELQVWMAHLSHANPKKQKRSFVSVDTLMLETGLSRNTICAAHSSLVKKGWLARYRVVNSVTRKRMASSTFCKWPPAVEGTVYARALRFKLLMKERNP